MENRIVGEYKVYVASSWRNVYQPAVVAALRSDGALVYDFRNPRQGDHGFSWREIDERWEEWSTEEFVKGLDHPVAESGFQRTALDTCDACVLVLPCGRSAHLELGYVCGLGKSTMVYVPSGVRMEPELMYKLTSYGVFGDLREVVKSVGMLSRAKQYVEDEEARAERALAKDVAEFWGGALGGG